MTATLTGFLKAAFVFMIVLGGSAQIATAHHHQLRDHRRVMACHQIDWQRDTARFIRCAARVWDAPGTPGYAVAIARRESGLRPDAYNSNGHGGLFQQDTGEWPGRRAQYLIPLGFGDVGWRNGEANTIMSVRMAKRDGTWSQQWTTA